MFKGEKTLYKNLKSFIHENFTDKNLVSFADIEHEYGSDAARLFFKVIELQEFLFYKYGVTNE